VSCLQFQVRASAGGGGGDAKNKVMIRKEPSTGAWKIEYSGEKPATPLLDTVNYPIHMKNLSTAELEQLAAELRAEVVHTVSKTGGHLSSSLGVVELAVALHHVFDTPHDKIIWDVGHQAYPHKILTGRRSRMHTIRQTSGLAGFPKRARRVRRGPQLHVHLRRAGHGGGARPAGPREPRAQRDRGRRHDGGAGVRGDEQRRVPRRQHGRRAQ
jgi:hypothetical protein